MEGIGSKINLFSSTSLLLFLLLLFSARIVETRDREQIIKGYLINSTYSVSLSELLYFFVGLQKCDPFRRALQLRTF